MPVGRLQWVPMKVMVTGGTGYIGAHTARLLKERGDQVIVVDDGVTGSSDRVAGMALETMDLAQTGSQGALTSLLREHEVDAVVHFAARKQVAESVSKPAWYYQQNVGGLAQLLMAMQDAGTSRLVFSSSAAVYGEANGVITEDFPTSPINPYGATKLAGEQLVQFSSRAWGLSASSLRYFNVAGAGQPELGDTMSLNLVSMAFDRIAAGAPPEIFGDDYPTADGTCVRDYVHVLDVAEAHLAVLDTLPTSPSCSTFNIGTGAGTTVREMVSAILRTSGSDFDPVVRTRRAGDPANVVANVDRMRQATGWVATRSLEQMVESAWQSRRYFASLTAQR